MDRIVAWAEEQPDIRALILIGSQARAGTPADEWSDIDLGLFTTRPERYLDDAGWVEELGRPIVTFVEGTAVGDERERRVLFEGGQDVDFAVIPVSQIEAMARAPGAATVLERGFRVLLDRDGIEGRLRAAAVPVRPAPPSAAEFAETIADFFYHGLWAARKLRRGELLLAKDCCDGCMKWLLVRMLRWHTGATRGWDHDTWHSGRFVERWADPRAVKGLRAVYAHYDEEDLRRALIATMELFRWVAQETAARLGYPYPTRMDEQVTALVEQCLAASR